MLGDVGVLAWERVGEVGRVSGGGGGLADQWPATGVSMITLRSTGPSGRCTRGGWVNVR